VRRSAILVLFLLAWSGPAPAAEDEPEKVSNDRPDRPLQMPPASSETKEAFDDFERFARRGAWERATKALYAIPEAQAARFVDGEGGFIISVARKRRAVLAKLSPEGQAAYRLFYDSDAKKLLDQADGPSEQATLERLFSSYFLTSVGDDAADRLGDLYFEHGQFDRAADCWLALLRERPDSDIPPARTAVKAALALARSGRRSELAALRAEVADRFADEVVAIGGRKAKAREHLRSLPGDSAADSGPTSAPAAADGPPPALPGTVPSTWQVRFAASVTAGMTPAELNQWEATAFSGAVPAVAVEGNRLYANYLGYVFALDLASGKMLWRSASFHNLEQSANQGFGQMIDPKRFALVAAPGFVWSLGRDPKDPNFQAASRLVCRRSETGEVVWQTSDLPDYAGMDLMGQPLLARGTIYLAGKSGASMGMGWGMGGDNQARQHVLAIRPHDGKVLWKTEVGIFREGPRYYYYGMPENNPQPRLAYRAGSLYLDTHQGVLARLDADSGTLEWGYGYQTDPVQMQGRFIFFFGMQNPFGSTASAPSTPVAVGDALLVKGANSDRLCAIDPDRVKVLWERPMAKSARLLGADEQTVFLGGPELSALDLKTKGLRWSTPLPGGSEEARVLVRPDGLWQLTPRGVFEVDPQSGGIRKIFRGDDAGSVGGDLVLTDRWVLAVSNKTIAAYPRGPAKGERVARAAAATPETGGLDD
jgi:outer membrane protein assembly factor BamB